MSLDKQLQEYIALAEQAEQNYPNQMQELAQLTGTSEDQARQRVEYMEQTGMYHLNKYVIADILLTYHRIKF